MEIEQQRELKFDRRGSIQTRFEEFHRKNPHIYEAFKERALPVCKNGEFFSARLITAVMSYDRKVAKTKSKDSFKINNDFSSRYARMFVDEFPQYRKFLEMRKLIEPERFKQTC